MTDAYYDKVSLLLPMNGADGGTVFSDYASTKKTGSAVGNAHTEVDASKYYGSSGAFDGSADWVQFPGHPDFNFGTGDFTIDSWIYLFSASSYQFLLGNDAGSGGHMMVAFNPSAGTVGVGRAGISWPLSFSGFSLGNNTWAHLEIARSGTSNYCFIDGVQIGSTLTDSTDWSFNNLRVGHQDGGGSLNGYIQDLRLTKGQARHTSNFTPPGALCKTLSGTVKDDANSNAIRTVTAVPRIANPRGFSTVSASDGTWSLLVPDVEHSIICLDDTAGSTYNDLIYRAAPV